MINPPRTIREAFDRKLFDVGFRHDGEWWRITTTMTDSVVCYLVGCKSGTEIKVPWHFRIEDARRGEAAVGDDHQPAVVEASRDY